MHSLAREMQMGYEVRRRQRVVVIHPFRRIRTFLSQTKRCSLLFQATVPRDRFKEFALRNSKPDNSALLTLAVLLVGQFSAHAGEFFVAPSGSDSNPGTEILPFQTVQKGLDAAVSGDTVSLKAGVYNERVQIKASGSGDSFVTLRNFGADLAVLDGTGLLAPEGSSAMIQIDSQSNIRVSGLEIRNYSTDATQRAVAGISVTGVAANIEFLNCHIHAIENNTPVDKAKLGRDAMGISVYGTNGTTPISGLLIDGCEVDHCRLGSSESLTLNGNVDGFKVSHCLIHDNDNIGMVAIGWEKTAPLNDQARNGIFSDNIVFNINSRGNPAYGEESSAAGIYVDGGRDIVIERNLVYACDYGIEIGVEHKRKTASGVIVRDNSVYGCIVTGLAFGGYDTKRGTTINCQFLNNTIFKNDTSRGGAGEVVVQQAKGNIFKNNILVSNDQNILVSNYFAKSSSSKNIFDSNMYYAPGGPDAARWIVNKKEYIGFDAYRKAARVDSQSQFKDPLFAAPAASPPDLHLGAGSPAIDAADLAFQPAGGETDFAGSPRLQGSAVDLGAFESP